MGPYQFSRQLSRLESERGEKCSQKVMLSELEANVHGRFLSNSV